MSLKPVRYTLTIRPHDGGWAVVHEGACLDQAETKDEARAAANKRARAAQDAGRPCQVVVLGEPGFFAG